MSPLQQFVTSTVTKMLFRAAFVSEVIALSGHFRLIRLQSEEFKGIAWTPGQKIQIHLGNLVCRTYTPIEWNTREGRTSFVAFLHGNGPGSEWAASLKPGSICQIMGPRSSLDFTAHKGDGTIFFGDETSIGAAAAHQRCSTFKDQNPYFFEVNSIPESQEVIDRLELKSAQLVAKSGPQHLFETESQMIQACVGAPQYRWIFTGNVQSIKQVKTSMRNRGHDLGKAETKAYWAYGKKGLD